ncbi:MAG: glycosyltransferase family 39 protein [Candidatus Undinarchaeales archaeon]|jgi:4-amino-4-deoxy-L-arabinose transferase-like glycosyltransferase|nr:glycosyltransferase family 39 protein [Candidatus Undinarchaeales archaeon]MDP7491968.1 glycosyltransferase family 39 protein [Candidatus Undinarchaeales archaeon]
MDRAQTLLIILLVIYMVVNPPMDVRLAGDENVYFLMGREVLRGSVPYRDFFFAHPPAMLYVLASSFMLLGTTWRAGTLVAALVNLGLLVGCYRLCARLHGPRAAVLASALLLGSRSFMFAAQTDGNALSLLFVVLALERHLARKDLSAGLLCGVAVLTKLFAVMVVPVILFDMLATGRSRRSVSRFIAAFVALTLPVTVLFVHLAGMDAVTGPVVIYHLQKEPIPLNERLGVIVGFLSSHPLALVAGLAAIRLHGRTRPGPVMLLFLLLSLFILVQKNILIQYLVYPLALLTVLAGRALDEVTERGDLAAVVLVLVLCLNLVWTVQWQWARFASSQFGDAVTVFADRVRATTTPEETVFGHSVAAATVAFLADRSMSSNVMDVFYARITSGMMDSSDLIGTIEGGRTRYLVLKGRRSAQGEDFFIPGIGGDPEFAASVQERWRTIDVRPMDADGILVLLEPRDSGSVPPLTAS